MTISAATHLRDLERTLEVLERQNLLLQASDRVLSLRLDALLEQAKTSEKSKSFRL